MDTNKRRLRMGLRWTDSTYKRIKAAAKRSGESLRRFQRKAIIARVDHRLYGGLEALGALEVVQWRLASLSQTLASSPHDLSSEAHEVAG